MLAKSGFDPRLGAYSGEDPEQSQRRTIAVARLASTGRDAALRRTLSEAAARFLAGEAAALDSAWYEPAFNSWLNEGGMASVRVLVDKALSSQDAGFRAAALDAVATTGDGTVSAWLLDEFKDPRLRPSEQRGLLGGIILTGRTRDIGYRWLKANLDRLTAGGDGIFFASRLPQLLGGFCSVARAQEFARDLRPRFAGKPGALELERSIERVRNCGVLRESRMLDVSQDVLRL